MQIFIKIGCKLAEISAHFIELKVKQMGFGLVEMMKNLIPLLLV